MFEIVIVEVCRYQKDSSVQKSILDWKDDIWWFEELDSTLEDNVFITGKEGVREVEAVMLCDAIRFKFQFCPNPTADNFDVSAMHDEFTYAKNTELFDEDLPKFASIVNRKLSGDEWDNFTSFYALYEVEVDKNRNQDGSVDSINVWPEFIGELDLEKLTLAVVQVQP
jgi:hypothetical protein